MAVTLLVVAATHRWVGFTLQDHAPSLTLIMLPASNGGQRKTENYYSTHNFATRVSFGTLVSVNDDDYDRVVRIFMGLS